MLANYNFQSDEKQRIVDLFDEYASSERLELWESFNAFYNCLYRNNISYPRIREFDKIKGIYSSHQKAFEEWINRDKPDGISSFYDFMQDRPHPGFPFLRIGGVINIDKLVKNDMAGRLPTNGDVVQYYADKVSLKEFLSSIYTIRCNKVHGDKNPANDSDIEILKKGSVALREFLEFLYTI